MKAREINANAVVIKAMKHPQNMSWDGFSEFTESTVAFIVVEYFQVEGIGNNGADWQYRISNSHPRVNGKTGLPTSDKYNFLNSKVKPITVMPARMFLPPSQSFRYISPRLPRIGSKIATATQACLQIGSSDDSAGDSVEGRSLAKTATIPDFSSRIEQGRFSTTLAPDRSD